MNDREKLIELLGSNNDIWADQKTRERLADHLIENGVTVRGTGYWKRKVEYGVYWYVCSECGNELPKSRCGTDYFSDYCPDCGAMMDGGTYDGTP